MPACTFKRLSLIFGLFSLSFLTACSDGPANTAEDFLGLVAAGELTEASELATDNTMQLLRMAQNFGALEVDPDFDFELIEEEVDGNRATVTYRGKKDGKVETIHLVKLDDEWKVHEQKH